MKDTSYKISKAPKSAIRELFDLASGRSDVISLGIGQPDFTTPEPAIQGNINALKKKITMYAPTRGVPELLQFSTSEGFLKGEGLTRIKPSSQFSIFIPNVLSGIAVVWTSKPGARF